MQQSCIKITRDISNCKGVFRNLSETHDGHFCEKRSTIDVWQGPKYTLN